MARTPYFSGPQGKVAIICLAIIVVGFFVELAGQHFLGTLMVLAGVLISFVVNIRLLRQSRKR